LGDDMYDDRAVEGGGLAESLFHAGDVVAVERTDVTHAQRLEERRGFDDFSDGRVKALEAGICQAPDPREIPDGGFDPAPSRVDTGVEAQPGEALGKTRNGRRVRAAVVVEDHDYPRPAVAEVVEPFVGHAAR